MRTLVSVSSDAKRPLRRLYVAEAVSGAGDGVFWVGLITALASGTSVGALLTLAVVARLGPRAVLSVPAGSLVDRRRLGPLLVAADTIRALSMGVLAVVVALGAGPIAVLGIVLVSYIVGVPTRPALAVLLPQVAGESRLAAANATLSSIRQVMTFVGPLIGVALAAWSVPGAFAFNGLTFLASAALVAGPAFAHAVPPVPAVRAARRRPDRSTSAATGRIGPLVGLIGVMYFVRGAEMVLHVMVATELLHATPATIGYFGGAIGIGAVLATPLARRSARATRPGRWIVGALVATAVPTAALAAIGHLGAACVLLAVVGAAMVVFEVISVITVQRVADTSMMGRSFGLINGVSNGTKLAGAVFAPILVAVVGVQGALVAVGAIVLAAGVLGMGPLVQLGRDSVLRRVELQPRVTVLAQLALFAGAPRLALERIAAATVEATVAAGTVLIREGDAPDDLFIARAGRFDVSIAGRTINTMGPDDWFGEIGLVDRVPRTATVSTTVASTVWRIPGDVFLAALEDAAAPPDALVQAIADRLAAGRAVGP